MYAGGLSYFSSGAPRDAGSVGASWAEAAVKAASETRQTNGIAVETVEDLIIELRDCVIEGLDREIIEAIHDLSNLEPPRQHSL